MKQRGRRGPSLFGRVRAYWLVGLVALALAASAGWKLATWPGFRLSSLTVSGAERVSVREIVARAAISPRGNVWLLDAAAAERRIEAIPYIDTAMVHRMWPAGVRIEVTERRPTACVRDVAHQTVTLDASSRVLEPGCAEPLLTYLVRGRLAAEPGTSVHDPELARLQEDARRLAATGDRYRAFAHDAFGELVATLTDGIEIRFGDDGDLASKQRLIGPILAQLGPRTTVVRAVDVRAPATPVVEYRASPAPPTRSPSSTGYRHYIHEER